MVFMFILQVMNNRDFKECDEKYVVTEGYVDGVETCDIPRLIFDNQEDANLYVENSQLALSVHKVRLLNDSSKLKIIHYLDIRYKQGTQTQLTYEIKSTNNFDTPDIDDLNDITIFCDSVHIEKVVPEGFILKCGEEQIIATCRKIFGYVKDNELFNTYKSNYITITDENIKTEFLDFFV